MDVNIVLKRTGIITENEVLDFQGYNGMLVT